MPDAVAVYCFVGESAVCFRDEVVEEAEVAEGEGILGALVIWLDICGDAPGRRLVRIIQCRFFGLIFRRLKPEPPC